VASAPRKQEQERARSEVREVAPGVLRMELPIRLPGLGHVNMYAIVGPEGAAVVDPGLPGPATWRAIQDRLGKAGLRPRHVHTVIVTHSHPDHFGGAARFAREAGAKVVGHHSFHFGFGPPPGRPEEASVDDLEAHREALAREEAEEDRTYAEELAAAHARGRTAWGGRRVLPGLATRLRWRIAHWLSGISFAPRISDRVEHGDVLQLAGREWFIVHTPGHTADHICLHDPETGTFLSGDHVLPSITPHIGGLGSSRDPLSSFFYSLDRVGEIQHVKQVLPAHGHPFADLRGRCEAIKRHHFERLARVKEISRELGAPASVEQFSQRLFRPRSWGGMAESETFAHLEHLRLRGEAERRPGPDGTLLYVAG
jgi:glyoxylase-like metal-dependent hydrolase (beta-lactamase superfamily II)